MRFEAFSFGSICIDGVTYEHDVLIDRGQVRKRKKKVDPIASLGLRGLDLEAVLLRGRREKAPGVSSAELRARYRADEARSRQDGSFGLGLSIGKWVAEAHHGAVELASQPGAGSAFTVTLPR